MEITLTIPDEIAPNLRNGGIKTLSRRALELLAIDGYKAGELTEYQVKVMLGFDDRFQVDAFLKQHGGFYDFTMGDLDASRNALEELLNRERR
ncbi:MAG: UPF0175 family protein [Acidobacteriota bacterium]|nr:UPF0175 family protein [Acidobacteriota bacterium]